jgi:hypothetical protein
MTILAAPPLDLTVLCGATNKCAALDARAKGERAGVRANHAPIAVEPSALIASVPHGKAAPARRVIHASASYRASAPPIATHTAFLAR